MFIAAVTFTLRRISSLAARWTLSETPSRKTFVAGQRRKACHQYHGRFPDSNNAFRDPIKARDAALGLFRAAIRAETNPDRYLTHVQEYLEELADETKATGSLGMFSQAAS
jgi:hypothetical protein